MDKVTLNDKEQKRLMVLNEVLAGRLTGAAPVDEWSPAGSLTAADGGARHHFGVAVAIDGDTVVVGAPGWPSAPDARPGAAYVFTHNGTAWVERTRLTANDGQHDDGCCRRAGCRRGP